MHRTLLCLVKLRQYETPALQCSNLRGGSDVGQLPYCYIRPSAKLAVKPTNWWLRPNLNGANYAPECMKRHQTLRFCYGAASLI